MNFKLIIYLVIVIQFISCTPKVTDSVDVNKILNKSNSIQYKKDSIGFGIFFEKTIFNSSNIAIKTCDSLTSEVLSNGFNTGITLSLENLILENNFQFRLGFKNRKGTLKGIVNDYKVPFRDNNDSIVYGVISEESTYNLNNLNSSILFQYPFKKSFPLIPVINSTTLLLGLVFEYNLSFSQFDSIQAISPDNLLMPNKKRIQEKYFQDELHYNNKLTSEIRAALSWELQLSNTLKLNPEISFNYQLNSSNSNDTWKSNQLNLGVSFMYVGNSENIIEAIDSPKVIVKTISPKPLLLPSVTTLPETIEVRIEEYDSIETLPLLNQLFFKEGSSELRENYKLFVNKKDAKEFTGKLYGNALDVYYEYLNLLGMRMKQLPEANLEITGYCNSKEKDKKLSNDRALVVKRYLNLIWGIAENRIRTLSGFLPPSPSSELTESGSEENSRVEIEADDPRITIPYVRRYIQQRANPPRVVFKPKATSEAGLKEWKLIISQDTSVWKVFSGIDSFPPKEIVWNWKNDKGKVPSFPMNLSYLLSLKDSVNQDTLSNSVIIKVNYDSLKFKLENNRNDTIIENFSLLLFDYDSPKISPSDKILLKAIASRIVDNAIVTIIGYTDSLGAEGYNKNLAISRAKETLKYLKILVPKNVIFSVDEINSGEFERFSYNSPEGRSHCRTVIIDVRIPIVRNKHNKK